MSDREDWPVVMYEPVYDYAAMAEDRRQRRAAHAAGRPHRLNIALGPMRGRGLHEHAQFKIGDVMFLGATEDREGLRARFAAAYPLDYNTPGPQPPFASTAVSVAERTGRALWLLHAPAP